jgi:DNA-binding winged helix-turn-helix (wHTH) protein
LCISEIRRALGDGANRTGLIETRHGRGYRLNAPPQRYVLAVIVWMIVAVAARFLA